MKDWFYLLKPVLLWKTTREIKKIMGKKKPTYEELSNKVGDLQAQLSQTQWLQENKENLTRQNEVFHTLLDNLSQGVFMVKAPTGKPIMVNKAAYQLLGWGIMTDTNKQNLSEVYKAYKESTGEIYPPDEMPIVKGMYGEEAYIDDMVIETNSGIRRNLEVFGSPVYNDEGEVWASIVSFTDISDRKKVEQALKESEARYRKLNATKDKLFSIISHDLKSPFNVILGFTKMALEKLNTKEYNKVQHHCEVIKQTTQQTFNLLNNLLNWSRLQTGSLQFNPESFNFSDLVNTTLDLLSANCHEKNIQCSVHIPENLVVFADKFMIETILRNLLSNAIKFTEENGWVQLSAQQKNGEILVEIEDNGIGISKEGLEKLFRIESTLKCYIC